MLPVEPLSMPGLGAGAELHTRTAMLAEAFRDACGTDAPALIADLRALENRAELSAQKVRRDTFEGMVP